MFSNCHKIVLTIAMILFSACVVSQDRTPEVKPGAVFIEKYLPIIGDRHIALVANHSSLVNRVHLVDTLLSSGIAYGQVKKLFCPEHGFRGERGAGVSIDDHSDPLTGIPVVSLYGNNKKPSGEQMSGIALVLFDLQDVGTRFYTYISTLHYVMEACAENGIPLVVLDRPNPNGGYVDGPVLEPGYTSFVGMHPIPVVYGMTMGELAQMINGEGWLDEGVRCDLTVIPCENYDHGTSYSLPVRPSPNLSNDHAIQLYPSTCFFEGTVLSEGRGTAMPFEVYGHPRLDGGFAFTPVVIPGVAGNPKFKGQVCYGKDLRDFNPARGWKRLHLEFLLDAYENFPDKGEFFTPYFETLSGTASLRKQIEEGWSEDQIRESWRSEIDSFKELRKGYIIYE
ncbi:MAG: DUF1343 domain-containing protein [Bacteroidetes bacterium]|nr:DUF1343 domain-containing protein [Bacteroidota bacterium]